jgi:small subunit ribosomal protein S16
MLVIRLARTGRENLQQFRLVVQEKTYSPKSGKVVSVVGYYNPADPDNKLTYDSEQITKFIKNGATPSNTVARLLAKNGFDKNLVEKFIKKYTKQKSKKAPEEKPAEAPVATENSEEKKEEPAAEPEKTESKKKPAEENSSKKSTEADKKDS